MRTMQENNLHRGIFHDGPSKLAGGRRNVAGLYDQNDLGTHGRCTPHFRRDLVDRSVQRSGPPNVTVIRFVRLIHCES